MNLNLNSAGLISKPLCIYALRPSQFDNDLACESKLAPALEPQLEVFEDLTASLRSLEDYLLLLLIASKFAFVD